MNVEAVEWARLAGEGTDTLGKLLLLTLALRLVPGETEQLVRTSELGEEVLAGRQAVGRALVRLEEAGYITRLGFGPQGSFVRLRTDNLAFGVEEAA